MIILLLSKMEQNTTTLIFMLQSLIRKIIDGGLPKLLTSLGWQVEVASPLILSATDESTQPLPKNCLNVGRSCETMKSHITSKCDDRTFPLILGQQ